MGTWRMSEGVTYHCVGDAMRTLDRELSCEDCEGMGVHVCKFGRVGVDMRVKPCLIVFSLGRLCVYGDNSLANEVRSELLSCGYDVVSYYQPYYNGMRRCKFFV